MSNETGDQTEDYNVDNCIKGSQTFQLPTNKNLGVLENQIENKENYQRLKRHFEAQGFEFVNSRSQIYISYDDTKKNVNPSLICIIPSLVPLDLKCDPSHRAVGIVAFVNNDNYSFFATEVLVNHSPFQIDTYSLFAINADNEILNILSVTKKELLNDKIETISKKIKEIKINQKGILNANVPEDDYSYVIKNSLSNFLNDEFTKHNPSSYKNGLLQESSLAEKFSLAIAYKKQVSASLASWSCSSTCCNGCTTTSSSWSSASDEITAVA
jgi:hypothetical protein